jgi:hypothetical protein
MIYVKTRHGIMFDLISPTAEMVDVRDLAWSLGGLPRFTKHTAIEWMVDQHTRLVAELGGEIAEDMHVPAAVIVAHCWLHDTGETYTNDISSPMKRAMLHYGFDLRVISAPIDRAIYGAFRFPMPTADEEAVVKKADLLALDIEKRTVRDQKPGASEWGRITRIIRESTFRSFADDLCTAVVAAGGCDPRKAGAA